MKVIFFLLLFIFSLPSFARTKCQFRFHDAKKMKEITKFFQDETTLFSPQEKEEYKLKVGKKITLTVKANYNESGAEYMQYTMVCDFQRGCSGAKEIKSATYNTKVNMEMTAIVSGTLLSIGKRNLFHFSLNQEKFMIRFTKLILSHGKYEGAEIECDPSGKD